MQNTLLHQVALTLVPHIGPVQAKLLIEHLGDATAVFKAKKQALEKIEGIGTVRAASIRHFADWQEAEKEIAFIERYKITPLFLGSEQYPRRLFHCYDPPTLLYYRGNAPLNAERVVAIVGTRYKTDYGRQLTEALVSGLARYNVMVISGLALGIDAIAHKAALKNELPTIGVLAHGLDKMYPAEHKTLAKDMLRQGGGLLTEFRSKTAPDKHHFPARNRIVAGMSDAAIIIETDIKGGSMITANLANDYNRDVFAFPGRTTDAKSAGCNQLIRTNKAMLITSAQELAEIMRWEPTHPPVQKIQQELFITLSAEEQKMVQLLKEKDSLPIDELNARSGLSPSQVAEALLNLELQQVLAALPGRRYRLN